MVKVKFRVRLVPTKIIKHMCVRVCVVLLFLCGPEVLRLGLGLGWVWGGAVLVCASMRAWICGGIALCGTCYPGQIPSLSAQSPPHELG